MTDTLDTLESAWSEARQGNGAFIQVMGRVGSGKTTLLNRLLESIDPNTDQAGVVSMRCGDGGLVRPSDRGELEELVARVTEGVRVIEWSQVSPRTLSLYNGCFLAETFCRLQPMLELPAMTDSIPTPSRAKIHAGLLFDVARNNPIVLILDDVHRTDEGSRQVLQELALALKADAKVKLLVVCTTTQPLHRSDATDPWLIDGATRLDVSRLKEDEIEKVMRQGFLARGLEGSDRCGEWIEATQGNPLVAHALLDKLDRLTCSGGPASQVKLPAPLESDEYKGLLALAAGHSPELRADVRADLQTAAVIGTHFRQI